MLGLDQNGGYVLSALAITVIVLGGYALYLRSRLAGLRHRRQLLDRAPLDEPRATPPPSATEADTLLSAEAARRS